MCTQKNETDVVVTTHFCKNCNSVIYRSAEDSSSALSCVVIDYCKHCKEGAE